MKIVIDARESGTTTGRYIDKLEENLYHLKPSYDFVILTGSSRLDHIKKVAPSFKVVESNFEDFSFAEQLGLKKQIQGLRPDLVHFGMTQQPILYRGNVVTTIHDLTTARFNNPAKNPVTFKFKQLVYRWVIKRVASKSKIIVTPSQFVKDDLISFAHINPSKVVVIHEAADKITQAAEPITSLKGKQFLFYVGRPNPHKNLDRLVQAYKTLALSHPNLLLVLAGSQDKNYQNLEKLIAKENLTSQVFMLGRVSEGALRWLYENCAVYVFPSLSEGFGLPGLEAMVHGAPVAAANTTSLPEIYGNAAVYFDPTDPSNIADAINSVLSDTKLRESLKLKGKSQAAKYSWRTMAEQTLDVYKQLIG